MDGTEELADEGVLENDEEGVRMLVGVSRSEASSR